MTNDYSHLPGLSSIYLEDSYVTSIEEGPNGVSFKLEAVLTPTHPRYHAPAPGEQYCYADGQLVFTNATRIDWIRRSSQRYVDASGEVDLGNIDSLSSEGSSYLVEGDWGEVRIHTATQPRFALSP